MRNGVISNVHQFSVTLFARRFCGSRLADCLVVPSAGALERWRHLQDHARVKDKQLKENVRQWAQFKCDVTNILVWLGDAEAIQMTQSTVPTQLRDIEIAVRRHQVGRGR